MKDINKRGMLDKEEMIEEGEIMGKYREEENIMG